MDSLTVKRLLSNTAILPGVVTILCLAPFVGKAIHLDDPVFIWSAKQIQTSPFDFYGFEANWYGTKMSMAKMHHNPPGVCYFIALAASLFGWSELALHTALLLPALAVTLGTYYLARSFCARPALAALAAALTPVFLVSGTTVMADTTMLAFWVWAVALWVRGINANKSLHLFFAALLIAICALTKYTGVALLGLLFVYAMVQKRKLGTWALFLLIPVAILAGFEYATYASYGTGLLSDAANYAAKARSARNADFFSNVLTGLSFTGGCILTALLFSPLLWSRRLLIAGVVFTILLILGLGFVEKIAAFSIPKPAGAKWGFLVQLGLMTVAGLSILALAAADFCKCRDAESSLLLLWVLGIFIFAAFLNWAVNARSILPMAPAVGILLMRRIDRRKDTTPQARLWPILLPLLPALLISMAVTWVDYKWAAMAREVAATVHQRYRDWPGRVWFLGHWGFQYYMEANGYQIFDFKHSRAAPADMIIIPSNNTGTKHFPRAWVYTKEAIHGTPCRWLALGSHELGAGFYASGWGPLPFAAGPVAPEKYYVFIFK